MSGTSVLLGMASEMHGFDAWATSVSRVPTARRGLPLPKQRPFAVETPTRSPVYDPGPMLTHTASQSESDIPRSARTSCTNTAVKDACALGAELSRYAVTAPFSANATEHRAVDVSIKMILSIFNGYESIDLMKGNTVSEIDFR